MVTVLTWPACTSAMNREYVSVWTAGPAFMRGAKRSSAVAMRPATMSQFRHGGGGGGAGPRVRRSSFGEFDLAGLVGCLMVRSFRVSEERTAAGSAPLSSIGRRPSSKHIERPPEEPELR